MRGRRRISGFLAALALTACGGSGAPAESAAGGGDDTEVGATDLAGALGTAEPLQDAVSLAAGAAAARPLAAPTSVSMGDVLTTDAVGLGQVTYLDGSLTRVGADTTLVLVRLASTVERPDVQVRLDVGRTFHAVGDVGDGRFEVETAVGTAAVRGTAFAVICLEATSCLVVVVDGVVEVTAADGTVLQVGAGQQVALGEDGPGEVVPAADDPWIDQNLALGLGPAGGDGDGGDPGFVPNPEPPPAPSTLALAGDVAEVTGLAIQPGGDTTKWSGGVGACDVAPAAPGEENGCAFQSGELDDKIGILTLVGWLDAPLDRELCTGAEVLERREAEHAGQVLDLVACWTRQPAPDGGEGDNVDARALAEAVVDGHRAFAVVQWSGPFADLAATTAPAGTRLTWAEGILRIAVDRLLEG